MGCGLNASRTSIERGFLLDWIDNNAPGFAEELPLPLGLPAKPVVAIFRSPIFNASETFIQTHATSLRRFQPLIIGIEHKGEVQSSLRDRVIVPDSARERLRFRLLGPPRALVDRIRAHAPAVLHAHFGPDGLIALPLARLLGIPLVTTLHGYEVGRSRLCLLTSGRLSWTRYTLRGRKLMAGGDLFVAVSEALRRRAIDRGYPPERTITHYNGVDLRRFELPNARPRPGLILHVCRLVEKKGTSLLIRAFAQVRAARPEARLMIVGDGPLRATLEQQAAEMGQRDCVAFLGHRDQQEVARRMGRAWLLAAPSITASDGDAEGLPTTVVEAAAASLPVVASDHSGTPEAVADGRSGFIVPEGDADALARRMLDLLGSPRLRTSMAAASRALAEDRFDALRQTNLLEGHYERLCRAAAPAGA
ncbi:MAG: colanic acid/amylovoran biosynthesis glycosyltransferase [Sphingomonadales bacterium]|jgi:glycosyltransferase involved in cell wall biosynthesis|nr:colanic acid/amylovoran biosynthesis glycosyltransferase [Sphingomonadales bacterium]